MSLTAKITLLCTTMAMIGSAHARGELTLTIPAAKAGAAQKQKVFIKSVTDSRKFEDKPKTANIPSLAAGLAKTPEAQRQTAIGRVRDGYGKARNNIFAVDAQPVSVVVKQVVANALAGQGYQIVDAAAADAVEIEIDVEQFWGYIMGGAWGKTMTMDGEMTTSIKVSGPGVTAKTVKTSAKASHRFGFMTGKHWVLMFSELMNDYTKNLQGSSLIETK